MRRYARHLLLGLGTLAVLLAMADLAAACHPCGYAPNERPCDWADEDYDGLDDDTNQPPSGATDHCRRCVIATETGCDHPSDCPPGDTCGNTDGVITLCGGSGANNIGFLTMNNSSSYQVCGAGGNDTIWLGHTNNYAAFSSVYVDGGDGDDTITTIGYYSGSGYTVFGGNGSDKIYGSEGPDTIYAAAPPWHFTGDDLVYGNGGNDTITGSHRLLVFGLYVQGNNTIHGGNGNDVINGLSGRDHILGEAGNDTVSSADIADQNPGTWAVTGSLLCGGIGDDTLNATGPAHQCLDGGIETNGAQGNDTCNYTFSAPGSARSAGVFDVGTKRNCNTDYLPVPCGCE
jgi:Ca2+-binding RTX toxin-like protein